MPDLSVVPFGAWPSPITASRLVEGAAGVGEIRADGTDVWWSEQRPSEGGRTQLVRRTAGGTRHDLFPPWDASDPAANRNARTAYLEYGGGAWAVRGGVVVYADWADQRLHRIDRSDGSDGSDRSDRSDGSDGFDRDDHPDDGGDGGDDRDATALTPLDPTPRALRWSEPTWLDDRWLVAVREDHRADTVAGHGEARNELVAVPLDGSAVDDPSRMRVLDTGSDFVHSPALSPDGMHVAWLRWDHPRMPWDGTELVVGTVERDATGEPVALRDLIVVAGGVDESVVQPDFTADGSLVFCTDRGGWWAPHRWRPGGEPVPVLDPPVEVEIGGPLWVGGLRWWAGLADGRLLVVARRAAADHLAVIEADGRFVPLDTPFTEISQVVAAPSGDRALVVAASPVAEAAPYLVGIEGLDRGDGLPVVDLERLRPPIDRGIPETLLSRPRHVTFPSAGGREAHALFYPPVNPDVAAPPGDLPPLIVMIHGGPTSAARHRLDLAKQFWTSRGFAVADIDYGGSVGYGRPYRRLLDGAWGLVDVEDAVAAARHLAAEGLVDPARTAIRGGSAGGYTTLAALCFHDSFAAGASHYGIADLSALAADTHKFESRYLDSLVGRWPEDRAVYEERSPIHHVEGFDRPLIVLQGDEDEVVPPNQAEMIVAALADRGVPHAYLLFEGEQHGFRQAANVVRALEAELWFYGRVFGFTPSDPIEPVEGAVGL